MNPFHKLEKAIKDGEANSADRFDKLEQAIRSLEGTSTEQRQQLEKSFETKVEQSIMNLRKKSRKNVPPLVQAGLLQIVQTWKTIQFSFKYIAIISNSYVLSSPVEVVAERNWSIYVFFDNSRGYDFSIYLRYHCGAEAGFCDASFTISFFGADKVYSKEFTHRFLKVSKGCDQFGYDGIMTWEQFPKHNKDATFTAQVGLKIYETYDPNQFLGVVDKFCSSTSFPSDCVLLIDGKRIHVSKGLLSVHSQFFNKLFNGEFAEKNSSEIAMEDLDVAEFCQLLQAAYPSLQETISLKNVECVIKLADRFAMDVVLSRCEQFLIDKPAAAFFTYAKKMLIAQEYGLQKLLVACIAQYKSVESLKKLKKEPEYALLSDKTKRALLDRMLSDSD